MQPTKFACVGAIVLQKREFFFPLSQKILIFLLNFDFFEKSQMTPACDPKQWVLGDLDDVTWTRVILAV